MFSFCGGGGSITVCSAPALFRSSSRFRLALGYSSPAVLPRAVEKGSVTCIVRNEGRRES